MTSPLLTHVSTLGPYTKGYPPHAPELRLDQVSAQGWRVLDGDLPFPLALLKASALDHNLQWMKAFCQARGIDIAPHGKTTLSPELYQRQLQAGAWGISFANVQQAGVGLRHGVERVLIANQVMQTVDLLALHTLQQRHPQARVVFLVDSIEQVTLIHDWQAQHPQAHFEVLLELGIAGKRTGVRSIAQGLQAVVHTRVHRRVRTIDLPVVVLVALPGRFVKGVHAAAGAHIGQSADLGQGQLMRQHRTDQVLGALAHGVLDQRTRDRRQIQVGQGAVEGHFEVAQCVDHGPVEVDDGGAKTAQAHQASAERIWSITAL